MCRKGRIKMIIQLVRFNILADEWELIQMLEPKLIHQLLQGHKIMKKIISNLYGTSMDSNRGCIA